MKDLKLIFGMAAISVGTVSAVAFAPVRENTTPRAPVYHWFNANSGNYLGQPVTKPAATFLR